MKLLIVFAAIWLSLCNAQSAGPPRSVLRHPAPERLVAIGDVHGDVRALRVVLRAARLIDRDDRWTGGRTTLVQVGDQTDRGDNELDIYRLLFGLQDAAHQAGGAVHILLGNHEFMNFRLSFRYVTDGGFRDFSGFTSRGPRRFEEDIAELPREERPRAAAFVPGGWLARNLAWRAQVSVIVGDSVFVHGGLQPKHLEGGADAALQMLNDETREFLAGRGDKHLSGFRGGDSPVWMRDYSKRGATPDCDMLAQTLRELQVRRMAMGHSVQYSDGVNAACGGRAWRIDPGIAAYYGGPRQGLEIMRDGVTRVIRA